MNARISRLLAAKHLACACAATAALAGLPGSAPGQTPEPAAAKRAEPAAPDRATVERRLLSVKTLIETSSAARQIDSSGKPEAQGQRNKARQLVRLAEDAFAAGDYRSASGLLDDAARQMFDGVRRVTGDREKGDASAAEIATRMESARALLAAQKRISAEKPGAAGETARRVEQLLDEARDQVAARRFAEARPLVEQAYLMAKAAIGAMRGGDTLVRSLNFATREDEYHYEIDRNDTHQMLVTLLVQKQTPGVGAIPGLVERARGLRGQAENAAARGDFEGAIRLLEDATRELVRAIRGAGIYIPG